jgi:hypothetical protein
MWLGLGPLFHTSIMSRCRDIAYDMRHRKCGPKHVPTKRSGCEQRHVAVAKDVAGISDVHQMTLRVRRGGEV